MKQNNRLKFFVNGMTCSQCENALTELLSEVDGVVEANVEATSGKVSLHIDDAVDRVAISDAVSEAGFELVAWQKEDQYED